MSAGATPVARAPARPMRAASASWIEALFACAAIALLWPLFAVLASHADGRDARFATNDRAVPALPPDVLPAVCHDYARLADRAIAADACGPARLFASTAAAGASSRLVDALGRSRAATGVAAPIGCLSDVLSRPPTADTRIAYANAALLVAAALNGRHIAAGEAGMPAPSRVCAGQATIADAIDRVAASMSDARRASTSHAQERGDARAPSHGRPPVGDRHAARAGARGREPRDALAAARCGRRARRMVHRGLGGAGVVALRGRSPVPSRRAPPCRSPRDPRRSCSRLPERGSSPSRLRWLRDARTLPQVPASRFGYAGFVARDRHRVPGAARPVGQRKCGQPLPCALLPRTSVARDDRAVLRRDAAPADRTRARVDAFDDRRHRERHRRPHRAHRQRHRVDRARRRAQRRVRDAALEPATGHVGARTAVARRGRRRGSSSCAARRWRSVLR